MADASDDSSSSEQRALLVAAIAEAADGDRGALRAVYDRTSAKLFGICLRICGEREGAEDVLQDVFVTVWQRAGRFDPDRASPITWLATIARNRAIDWRRAQGRHRAQPIEAADRIADPAPLASDLIGERQDAARLKTCLDGLEDRTAEAIRAAFLDGATYAELAERAAVPLGTMKSWIRRGLIRLKDCLGDG